MGEQGRCEKEKCECKGNGSEPCPKGQEGMDAGAKTREYGESAKHGAGRAGEHARGAGEDMKNKAKGVDMNQAYEHSKGRAHQAGEAMKGGAKSAYEKTKDVAGKARDKFHGSDNKDNQ